MGTLFRSEKMAMCQLYLQSEASYSVMSELGEMGLIQFKDLNLNVNAFQRRFITQVRKCEEMERILRFLEKELKKASISIHDPHSLPEAPATKEMTDMETEFEKQETDYREVSSNNEAIKRNHLELLEMQQVLEKASTFFEGPAGEMNVQQNLNGNLDIPFLSYFQPAAEMNVQNGSFSTDIPMESVKDKTTRHFGFLAGVIPTNKVYSFERMLWFACRGNVFLRRMDIEEELEEPHTGDMVRKTVFILFFQGDRLKGKCKKICEGFKATLYGCPEDRHERDEMLSGIATRIEDLKMVLEKTQDHKNRMLHSIAQTLRAYFVKVKKIKAIYVHLNMFNVDVTQKCLVGECWVPTKKIEDVRAAIKRGTDRSGSDIPSVLNEVETTEAPPTFNDTNKFTAGFQSIVDSYGVANYEEVNPTPFLIITFPFLFAMMFGDCGHGVVMFSFALWMVVKEKSLLAAKSNNEIWNTFFGGRYIILFMGIFSMYTGLIFNDFYSRGVNLLGTRWTANFTTETIFESQELQLDPGMHFDYNNPYQFGIDPIWLVSKNKMIFLNSYKMKLSVIFGVVHMLFGVILSIFNHIHFKKYMNIFCETIPEILFLMGLFGYLVVLIFYKWIQNLLPEIGGEGTSCSRSLLLTLINMFMFRYEDPNDPEIPCNIKPLYEVQPLVQSVLVVVAVLCVPMMLIVKPCILGYRLKRNPPELGGRSKAARTESRKTLHTGHDEGPTVHHSLLKKARSEEAEGQGMGDIVVHQCIHTIEYCLGCVSNTASYLRLWALSLAHGQLSEVLWNMILKIGFSMGGWVGAPVTFAVFAPWALLTVAVLILMEGLSAFLHALRLHWVEFQNKFYTGNGYAFTPYSFKLILDTSEEGPSSE